MQWSAPNRTPDHYVILCAKNSWVRFEAPNHELLVAPLARARGAAGHELVVSHRDFERLPVLAL